MKILLVEHIHQAAIEMLSKKMEIVFPETQNEEGILASVGDCDAIIARGSKITGAIMKAAPRLQVVARHGVGYDSVDLQTANALKIPVVYTPAANTESVVELAMGFILCLCRKIVRANTVMQSGHLLSDKVTLQVMTNRSGLVNADLWGQTMGVVGVGRIGSSLSKKMIAAFNLRVLGYDPYVDAKTLAGCGVQKTDTLEEMLPQCDFVTLHCPGNEETRNLINRRTLEFMKPGAYLINTARGMVVDEEALAEALQKKKIAGAALDVFEPEPPLPGNPLLHMENVIVTPHYGAQTAESLYNMATMAAQGVIDVLEGKRPQYLVNPGIW
jgi:D-3-phosphoglycerate dehydrogenase / 2-oxoglutarate reductase